MIQEQKSTGKEGRISQLLRAVNGGGTGRKRREKAARGSELRFRTFAEKWLREYAEKQLKPRTVEDYRRRLERINGAIGHIRLRELDAGHLNAFYAELQEEGERRDTKFCLRAGLTLPEGRELSREALARAAGLSRSTVQRALGGKNISGDSARRIAEAYGLPPDELFCPDLREVTLDPNTVRSYHRIISSMLNKAVKWGYIPANPAVNAELPKLWYKEAAHLDEGDARRLLELLQNEPIKYRAAVTVSMLSGLRRGELLGLRWRDVDPVNHMVTVVQTSTYISGKGLCIDTPKNHTSARPLKLSASVFPVLEELREWQEDCRRKQGDGWLDRDGRVFTNEKGAPLHPEAFSKWFRLFVRRCGLPPIHVHSLRHTYASLMIADGIPLVVVSRRLGHAQVSTTANIYAHVIAAADERAAQVADKFGDIIARRGEDK